MDTAKVCESQEKLVKRWWGWRRSAKPCGAEVSSDQEFQYVRGDIGKNSEMLNYFNTNFTKLTGIPSTSYEEPL